MSTEAYTPRVQKPDKKLRKRFARTINIITAIGVAALPTFAVGYGLHSKFYGEEMNLELDAEKKADAYAPAPDPEKLASATEITEGVENVIVKFAGESNTQANALDDVIQQAEMAKKNKDYFDATVIRKEQDDYLDAVQDERIANRAQAVSDQNVLIITGGVVFAILVGVGYEARHAYKKRKASLR